MDDLKVCFDWDDEVHREDNEETRSCSTCEGRKFEEIRLIYRFYISDINYDIFAESVPMLSDITKYMPFCDDTFTVYNKGGKAVVDEDNYSNGSIHIFQLENNVYVMKIEFFIDPNFRKTFVEIEIYGKSLDNFQALINDILTEYDNNTAHTNSPPYQIDYDALNNVLQKAISKESIQLHQKILHFKQSGSCSQLFF